MKTGKKSRTRIKVEESSGNVFRDLGLENPDLLLAKSTIIVDIHSLLNEHGLTDEAAAKLIGISAHDLDQVIRGDLDRYSKRELQRFLRVLRACFNGRAK